MPLTVDDLRTSLLRIVRKGDDHTCRQVALLLCLKDGPRTVRDLAAHMNVIKPVVTRGVDRLVVDAYAERLPDPDDRRSVLVRLLPAGKRFVEDMAKT